MQRTNKQPERPRQIVVRRRGPRQFLKLSCFSLLLALTLSAFICVAIASILGQTATLAALVPNPTRTPLPTFTPTSLPTLTPTINSIQAAEGSSPSLPVSAPTATPSPLPVAAQLNSPAAEPTRIALSPSAAPSPAPTPSPSPTPIPGTSGWTFTGVTNLAGNSRKGRLLLTGELVNDTGAPQEAVDISGVFYGGQGEVPVDNLELVSYVPVDPIPANARVPFELQVSGNQEIEDFDLYAWSQPANDLPRYDFQFSNVEQSLNDATGYCIRGQVDNQGPPVQEYLIVLATGYDDQGSIVNFGEYFVDVLPESGGANSPFELCLDSLGQHISRHDLIAYGD